MVAPGEAAAPAAVDKPSRSVASPAVAYAAGRDNRAYCWLLPSWATVLPLLLPQLLPLLLPLSYHSHFSIQSSTVDVDGDVQTHDGPVNKAKLAAVPTTLLGSTGRNPEKQTVVKRQAAAFLQQGGGDSYVLMPPFSATR